MLSLLQTILYDHKALEIRPSLRNMSTFFAKNWQRCIHVLILLCCAFDWEQGYAAFLRSDVLEKAGLCLDDSARQKLADDAKHVDEVKAKHEKGEFDTLEQCTEVKAPRRGTLSNLYVRCILSIMHV